jgi:hypothetical protein
MTNQVQQIANRLSQNYSHDVILGRLCWYSLADTVRVTRKDFLAELKAQGVSFGSLPDIRTVDVFKRGCTASERNKYLPSHQECVDLGVPYGCHINYMFRNAGQDKDKVWRTLVREIVDSNGHELSYMEVASLIYNRSTESIDYQTKVVLSTTEQDIVQDVYNYVKAEADIVTPYAIREFIRKGIEWYLHAIKVRPSGGLYFVQEQFYTELTGLSNAVNNIGGTFHDLPLLDDSKQREMLRKAFEDESLDDVNVMLGEMAEILKSNKMISQDRFVDMKDRYHKLIKKVKEYSDILDEAMTTTSSYLDIADAQMKVLWDNNVKKNDVDF